MSLPDKMLSSNIWSWIIEYSWWLWSVSSLLTTVLLNQATRCWATADSSGKWKVKGWVNGHRIRAGTKTEMSAWVIESVFAVYWTMPLLMRLVQRTYCLKTTQSSERHACAWTDNPGLYREKQLKMSQSSWLPQGRTEKCDTPASVIAQVPRPWEQFTRNVCMSSDWRSELSFLTLHECYPCFLCVCGSRDTRVRQEDCRRQWCSNNIWGGVSWWEVLIEGAQRRGEKKDQQCEVSFFS